MKEIEYPCIKKLTGIEGRYFVIPADIILNTDLSAKRIAVFSYFCIRRGLDQIVHYSTNEIINWLGLKTDRHPNGINDKINQIIDTFSKEEYLLPSEPIHQTKIKKSILNLAKISTECENDRFAVIYIDELQKIMQYKKASSNNTSLNNDAILLVFAYLRMKIYRRRNQLFSEEINCEKKKNNDCDIENRRLRAPEAYDSYYCDISDTLKLSSRVISNAVTVLNELGLIFSEALPRIRYCDGITDRWRTDHTIFSNMYKREDEYLLASGENYYRTEVDNKKKKLFALKNR